MRLLGSVWPFGLWNAALLNALRWQYLSKAPLARPHGVEAVLAAIPATLLAFLSFLLYTDSASRSSILVTLWFTLNLHLSPWGVQVISKRRHLLVEGIQVFWVPVWIRTLVGIYLLFLPCFLPKVDSDQLSQSQSDRQGERQWEKHRRQVGGETSCPLIYNPNGYDSQGCARLEPGA